MKKKSSASLLPHEVVLEILSHLPARSIARFRAVSARWRASTSERHFLVAQLRRAPPAIVFQVPISVRVFLPRSNPPVECHLFLLNGDTNTNSIRISIDYAAVPDATHRTCLSLAFSCDDLLCFLNHDVTPGVLNSHYVFSLVTGEWTAVTKVNSDHYGSIVAFYSHPSTKEYRFLRALGRGPELNGFEVNTLGSNTWRPIANPSRDHLKFLQSICCSDMVFLHDGFYWVSDFPSTVHNRLEGFPDQEICIMVFDTDTEEFRKIPLPGNRPWRLNHLFDMEGSLGMCQITAANEMVVWELSKNSDSWVRRSVISSASFKKNPRNLSNNIFLLKPVAIWKQDELLLHYVDTPYIYNFKLKTLKPVETNLPRAETNLPNNAFCFVIKESIAFCEAFKTDHSSSWHGMSYICCDSILTS